MCFGPFLTAAKYAFRGSIGLCSGDLPNLNLLDEKTKSQSFCHVVWLVNDCCYLLYSVQTINREER